MSPAPPTRRPRIWVLMAVVAASAIVAWVLVDPLPRFRAWWTDRHIYAALESPGPIPLPPGATLGDLLKGLRVATVSPALPQGVPVYINPAGLAQAGQTITSPLSPLRKGVSLGVSTREGLNALGLTWEAHNGVLHVVQLRDTSK